MALQPLLQPAISLRINVRVASRNFLNCRYARGIAYPLETCGFHIDEWHHHNMWSNSLAVFAVIYWPTKRVR